MEKAARQTPLTALAGLACLAVVMTLGAGAIVTPLPLSIGFAVAFVLALRFIGTRDALAEWAFVRLPALLIAFSVAAAILWLAIYGLY